MATSVAALPGNNDPNAQNNNVAPRMLITSASIRLIVQDPVETLKTIEDYLVSIGGYVINGNSTRLLNGQGTEIPQSRLTVRIPSERFDEAMIRIKAMAVRVEVETVYGQDVTDQFTDMSTNLKNLESAEAQLREIMDKAETSDEVLRVFSELTRIRGEIELIKGRMQQISGEVAYSALAIELIQVLPPTITPTPTSTPTETPVPLWRPVQSAVNAAGWLGSVFASMVDLLVWGGVAGAPLLMLAIIALRTRRGSTPQA
jgi:hypothetical protein